MFGGDKCPPNHYAELFSPFALSSLTASSLLNQAQRPTEITENTSNPACITVVPLTDKILILLDYEGYSKQ